MSESQYLTESYEHELGIISCFVLPSSLGQIRELTTQKQAFQHHPQNHGTYWWEKPIRRTPQVDYRVIAARSTCDDDSAVPFLTSFCREDLIA